MQRKAVKVDPVTGQWIDTLVEGVGGYIHVETGDGCVRSGRLTGLTTRKVGFNHVAVYIPTEVELNGDPHDRIPLERIVKIELA